jgi:hypothetical protein
VTQPRTFCSPAHPIRCPRDLASDRVLTGQSTEGPLRTVFSIVVGSHTHYFAAATAAEARQWVGALREAWLHCFRHAARSTGGGGGAAAASHRLMAENAVLRESLRVAAVRRSAEDSEYWR